MEKNAQSVVIYSLLSAILLTGLFLGFVHFYQPGLKADKKTEGETIVAIDYGNGKVRKFQGPIFSQTRVWDAFQQAIAAGGISVEISDHFIPEKIDGLKSEIKGKRWNLYLNGVKQEFVPFEIYAKPGDEVVFKYE